MSSVSSSSAVSLRRNRGTVASFPSFCPHKKEIEDFFFTTARTRSLIVFAACAVADRTPPANVIKVQLFNTVFCPHSFIGENIVSTLGRAVLIIWLFVVLIIQSSYTASLTSILTVQQLSSPIKGIDNLIASNEPICMPYFCGFNWPSTPSSSNNL